MRIIIIFSVIAAVVLGIGYYVSNTFNPDSELSPSHRIKTYQEDHLIDSAIETSDIDTQSSTLVSETDSIDQSVIEEAQSQILEISKRVESQSLEIESARLENQDLKEHNAHLQEELEQKNTIKIQAVKFHSRPVPPLSALKSSEAINSDSFDIIVDKPSNSWLVRGNQEFIDNTMALVEAMDVMPQIYDLDILYIAISETRVRSLGLSAMFQDGASYLNAIDLDFDTLGMDLVLGNVLVEVDWTHRDDDLNVVTFPMQRITTGTTFTFGNVDQIPIETQAVSDGISQSGFTYRPVGLSFEGQLNRVGPRFYLNMVQSLGTVVEDAAVDSEGLPPVLREANSESSTFVRINQWSCFSGMMVERALWSRGILSKKRKNTRDLVLMFVRVRDRLLPIPKAIPVSSVLSPPQSEGLLPPLEQ